jgi:hypothetical protein
LEAATTRQPKESLEYEGEEIEMEGTCTLSNGTIINIIEQQYASELGKNGSHHYYTIGCPKCGKLHLVEDKHMKKQTFTGLCINCSRSNINKESLSNNPSPPIIQINLSNQSIQRISHKEDLTTRTEKKCSRCGIIKPMSEFYLESSRIDGRSCACKTCYGKPNHIAHIPNTKYCRQCKQTKLITNFFKRHRSYDGYSASCKQCIKSTQKLSRIKYTEINNKRIDEFTIEKGKECPECHIIKPLKYFNITKEHKDGHSLYCSECNSKKKLADYNRLRGLPNNLFIQWRVSESKRRTTSHKLIKEKVFSKYCPNGIIKCANPFNLHKDDVTDIDILTIDHINGDVHAERLLNSYNGKDFYRFLANSNKRDDLQVLCNNCQMKKAHIKHEYRKPKYLSELKDIVIK